MKEDKKKPARARFPRLKAEDEWLAEFHTPGELENAPPVTFAIKGFLQNHGITLLAGLPEHGKTLVMFSMARALLASGTGKLWGHFQVQETASRVIYITPEVGLSGFKHRLRLFGLYDIAQDWDRLFIHTLSHQRKTELTNPLLVRAAKNAHIFLDPLVRFGTGNEDSAADMRKLGDDLFALLRAGARSIVVAHHSPKSFRGTNVMNLENMVRGSGDIGAWLTTAWGIKQINRASNILHIENIKLRDFEPCGPFQISGRPWIDEEQDFRIHKKPGECGPLAKESKNRGGATTEASEARSVKINRLTKLVEENPKASNKEIGRLYTKETGDVIPRGSLNPYLAKIRADIKHKS